MENTSQSQRSDARLSEIERLFGERQSRRAIAELDRLGDDEFSSDPIHAGHYALLLAEKAIVHEDYKKGLEYSLLAMDHLGTTSLNNRIGRAQYLAYISRSALGDLKGAEQSARDALASYRRVKNGEGIIDAYNGLGKVYFIRSQYSMAAEYLTEALLYAENYPVKKTQIIGNLGRICLLTGELDKAQEHLEQAMIVAREHDMSLSLMRNYLSLAYIHLRRRHFYQAELALQDADNLIQEEGCKRERVIYLEYFGELCLEKQDFVNARKWLKEAVSKAEEIAPESALMSQSLRRLAQAEVELGYHEPAMRNAQKALDLSQKLGETAEEGLAHRVIANIFLSRNEVADARRHALEGIDILRAAGDVYELGRSVILLGAMPPTGVKINDRKPFPLLQEAEKLFASLGDEYNLARCRFEMGRHCHNLGKNADALEYLKEAVKGFRAIGDNSGTAAVNEFLQSLSQIAIQRALSEDNEYKIFGNFISDSEYHDLKSGELNHLLDVLVRKTLSDRGIIINLVPGKRPEIAAAHGIGEADYDGIASGFSELIADRIIMDKPILVLDCTNEINFVGLMPEENGSLASLIVLPLVLRSEVVGYIYLDRLANAPGRGINPFAQKEIDFAVGFAELAALKTAEYLKEKLYEDNVRLKAQLLEECSFPNIITQSHPFMEMLSRVRQVANSNMAISLHGETGTGKDLLVKAIHYNSNRRDRRLISVNCAALPETLLESELFGFKKGAFTGADRDKPGLFEEADGGTFFLDEIADMPLSIQAKVLRLLESMEITRLGDTKPRRVDVRVISATNKDLKKEMEEKRFRSDLYYRLCALHFSLPSLRERKEDIPLLVEHFLGDSRCQITPEAMKYLIDYDWPGNIRELENEIKKLILLANNDGLIGRSLLSAKILGEGQQETDRPADELSDFSRDGFSLYDYLAEFEKRFIVKALKEQGGVKKRAADSLNIPESTLRLKLKQYDIDPKRLDIN